MGEISRELAFAYRKYLESLTQLKSTFSQIHSPPIPPFDSKEAYARLLIAKNLSHAFTDSSLEPLTYFQFKEHLEKGIEKDFICEASV